MRNTMKLVFMYETGASEFGSTKMRGHQIASQIKNIDPTTKVDVYPASYLPNIENSIIILLKPVSYDFYILNKRSNILIIDPLDQIKQLDIHKNKLQNFMACITSTANGKSEYAKYFNQPDLCTTIYHHWDPIFYGFRQTTQSDVRIGYFGINAKAYNPNGFRDIKFNQILTTVDMKLELFDGYNCHYVIKPPHKHHYFEPLTKISTSAATGSPVIAHRSADELLGTDYPYLVSEISIDSISNMITHIKRSYGSNEWISACNRMKIIKQITSLEYSGKIYYNYINTLQKML